MSGDCASVEIARPAAEVFAFMADPANLNRWSFGTWNITIGNDGLVEGRAMADGRTVFVRIVAHENLRLIDYEVGATSSALTPRIFVRIAPGSVIGKPDHSCHLMMIAMRSADMDDGRWQNLINVHAVEVELIRSIIESGYDHRAHP